MTEDRNGVKFIDRDPPIEDNGDRSFFRRVLDYLAYLKETLNFIFSNYGRRLTDAAGNINELTRTSEETTSRLSDAEGNIVEVSQRLDGVDSVLTTKVSTADMQSAITQSASAITSQVAATYTTQSVFNTTVSNLQDQIDGAIETFTGSVVPTLNNQPAVNWTTDAIKNTHIGDLYVVDSSGGDYAGFYYRFEKNGNTYQWVLLEDTEVTKALREAEEANRKADALAADLANNYPTTVQMQSAINQSASNITSSVSATYETKTDATSKLSTAKTYAEGQASSAQSAAISAAASDATNKANAALSSANSYTDDLASDIAENYPTKVEMQSEISQSAGNITSSVRATYETKADAASKLNTAKTYAEGKASDAQSAAISAAAADATTKADAAEAAANDYTDGEISTVNTRIASAESSISQNARNIELKVSQTDYNGNTIASLINQSASTVTINADHINLNGAVTANNNVQILQDGTIKAVNAELGGVFRMESGGKIYYASDYTEEDVNRIRDIVYEQLEPTIEELEKYDFSRKGKISMSDLIICRDLVNGEIDYYQTKAAVAISPVNGEKILVAYTGHNDNWNERAYITPTEMCADRFVANGGAVLNSGGLSFPLAEGETENAGFGHRSFYIESGKTINGRYQNLKGTGRELTFNYMESSDSSKSKSAVYGIDGIEFNRAGTQVGYYPPNFKFWRQEVTLNQQYCVLYDSHFKTDSIVFAQTYYTSNQASLTATVTPQITQNGACVLYFRMPSGTIADGTKVNVQIMIIGGTV